MVLKNSMYLLSMGACFLSFLVWPINHSIGDQNSIFFRYLAKDTPNSTNTRDIPMMIEEKLNDFRRLREQGPSH